MMLLEHYRSDEKLISVGQIYGISSLGYATVYDDKFIVRLCIVDLANGPPELGDHVMVYCKADGTFTGVLSR